MTYAGWWQVPAHLLPATALAELEYPRTPGGQQPVAWVECRDWRDRKTSIPLYDARACPPTKATAAQLEAAARRATVRRVCADCQARCQRPLPLDPDDRRPRCPACRQLARLRTRQAQLAQARPHLAARAAELLSWPDAAILQVDLTVPPPTPAGRRRPATAAHLRAVDLHGMRLVQVLVRLVGPRAHHVPVHAVPAAAAAPVVHRALLGRRLLTWSLQDLRSLQDLERLHQAAPHPDLPRLPRYPRSATFPSRTRRSPSTPAPSRSSSWPPAGAASWTPTPGRWSPACRPAPPTGCCCCCAASPPAATQPPGERPRPSQPSRTRPAKDGDAGMPRFGPAAALPGPARRAAARAVLGVAAAAGQRRAHARRRLRRPLPAPGPAARTRRAQGGIPLTTTAGQRR